MFKTFFNWVFDGNIKSPIPRGENIPGILKYNSPITSTYVISLFLNNGPLNFYLDSYFNNINLRYIDKEELLFFIKKCVIDFKVQRKNIPFVQYKKNTKLFDSLRAKIPIIKNYDVSLLCDLVEKSPDAERIYSSLGIDKPKKKKLTSVKQKNEGKTSLQDFLSRNFSVIKI